MRPWGHFYCSSRAILFHIFHVVKKKVFPKNTENKAPNLNQLSISWGEHGGVLRTYKCCRSNRPQPSRRHTRNLPLDKTHILGILSVQLERELCVRILLRLFFFLELNLNGLSQHIRGLSFCHPEFP